MADNNKIKILMANFEFPPIGGGGGKANKCILEEFANMPDLQIDLITSKPTNGTETVKFADNINIIKIGISKKDLHHWRKSEVIAWLWKANKLYRKLISENKYDLAHAFFAFPTGLLCYKYRKKLPYIVSLRGSDVPGKNPRFVLEYKLLSRLFKKIWRNASVLIACSRGLRDRAKLLTPQINIAVIPNGVNTGKFSPSPQPPKDCLNLITVGRLSESKRVELLIETLSILRAKDTNFKLSIVGDGKMRPALEDLAKGLKLTENIIFYGRVDADRISEIYKRNNLYLSASFSEGMSNAMLEAMASGLPIITTACEGVEELIQGNGIIVEAKPEKIAEAIEKLYMNYELRNKMAAESRRISNDFSWKNTAESYLNIYKEVVSK